MQDNLADVERLVAPTLDRPLAVRFIDDADRGEPAPAAGEAGLLRRRPATDRGALVAAAAAGRGRGRPRTGPAKAFRLQGAQLSFTNSLSHTFCSDCNRSALDRPRRVRLVSLSSLTACTHCGCCPAPDSDAVLEAEILRVLQDKPAEHMLTQGNFGNLASFMQIGG